MLDNKTKKPTNEANYVMSDVLIEISNLYKTIVTIGNHDYDCNNKSTLDCITPIANIFKELGNTNLIYLKKTKMFSYENICFLNYSNWEDNSTPPIKMAKRMYPDAWHVGLFHDVVKGAKNFQGKDFTEMVSHAYDPMGFKGCDAVFMGDIHKHQEIECDLNIPIVYAGSLNQINFGENVSGHGYCIWDVATRSYDFIEIENNYGLYKFSINKFDDFENGKQVLNNL